MSSLLKDLLGAAGERDLAGVYVTDAEAAAAAPFDKLLYGTTCVVGVANAEDVSNCVNDV